MPDYYPPDEQLETEDEYPEDDYPQDELCEDESCSTCYPQDDEIPEDIPEPTWTFPATSSTGSFINYTSNTTDVVNNLYENMERIRSVIAEGEEMPDTPEMPEVSPESPEVSERIRPVPVPSFNGVTFGTSSGRTIAANTARNSVVSGCTLQIAFWGVTPAQTKETYRQVKEWLVANEFGFSAHSSDSFGDGEISCYIPYYFVLCDAEMRGSVDPAELLSQPPCWDCGEDLDYPSGKCPNCETVVYCSSCRAFSTGVHYDESWGAHCDSCGRTCPDCQTVFNTALGRECPDCHPRVNCNGCRENLYIGRDEINEFQSAFRSRTYNYCVHCYRNLCHSCEVMVAEGQILEEDGHQCVACVSRNSHEEWDENSQDNDLLIPTIPGRETIRLVGVEIEGANGEDMDGHEGGNILARRLYDDGISRSYEMGGYHSGSSRGYKVHVERDSSVDWEMVIGPLNVAEESDVEILNRSVRVVRGFINDKTLKLDMRAGLHIHVGADKVPFHNAYNLHKLYMYTEDFLYRLGAAKWPHHRSINRRGRDQAGKSPNTEGKMNFARTFSGQRYYGLSFDNYFARYFEHCQCGARTYGVFDECTCDLGKCTFEFRLFNTTANTIKLHAYLAICQALVAKAIELDEIQDARQYPPLDFVKSRVSDMHPSTRAKMGREWEKRIVFVNEQLPLTPEEKKSIHYCVMNSELGKIVTNADILLETEEI